MSEAARGVRFDEPEDFCGLQQMVSDRATGLGTKYEIVRWTCPHCGKACSCIQVDGEWCHGDALIISFGPEKDADGTWTRHHKCAACWAAPRMKVRPDCPDASGTPAPQSPPMEEKESLERAIAERRGGKV